MKALAQCWFTRMHMPEGRAHKDEDGSFYSRCRHCERDILSWDRSRWFLADGFNVTHLAETVGGRFLFVLDTAEEQVIARYPVANADDKGALDELKAEIRARHRIDEPGSTLELHDSGAKGKAIAKGKGVRAPRMPNMGRSRLSAQF
jgi:hypothetical protein